jgi:hypothetical protein
MAPAASTTPRTSSVECRNRERESSRQALLSTRRRDADCFGDRACDIRLQGEDLGDWLIVAFDQLHGDPNALAGSGRVGRKIVNRENRYEDVPGRLRRARGLRSACGLRIVRRCVRMKHRQPKYYRRRCAHRLGNDAADERNPGRAHLVLLFLFLPGVLSRFAGHLIV